MSLQNFIDKVGPVVSATWLNAVDLLKETIFENSTTKAQARIALTNDAPLEVVNGGTGQRTLAALSTDLLPYTIPGDVRNYGAVGDGSVDDAQAFIAAMAANTTIYVPDPPTAYKIATAITVPDNVTIRGDNKYSTKIVVDGGIDTFTLGNGVALENLSIDGNGQSARGLVIGGTEGNQTVRSCRIFNFNGSPVEFTATTAGSRCSFENVEAWQTNGSTGSGKYAFVMATGAQLTAVPRKFSHIETAGYCAFNFGGCNDVFVEGSFIGDLNFTSNSRGVHVNASRIANQATLDISGPGVTITGCGINPDVTVSGAGPVVLEGNYYNGTVEDTGTTGTSLISKDSVSYTPTWTGAGGDPVIGNGTLRGEYSRNGDVITLGVEITMGSSTTFGSGQWRVGLPMIARPASGMAQVGTAFMLKTGANFYFGFCVIPNGSAYLYAYPQMKVDSNGDPVASTTTVQSDTPFTWANGDILRINTSYFV